MFLFSQLSGSQMCTLSREAFLEVTPGCVGDILYQHLQQMLMLTHNNGDKYSRFFASHVAHHGGGQAHYHAGHHHHQGAVHHHQVNTTLA